MNNSIRFALTAAFLVAFIPGTAVAQTPTIEDYGKLPGLEQAALAPDGQTTAMIATIADSRKLLIVRGGSVIRQLNVGDAKIRDIDWANNDLLMIDISQTEDMGFRFRKRKQEIYRTMFLPVDGEPSWLFENRRDMANATFGWYGVRDISGKTYGYFGGLLLEIAPGSTGLKRYQVGGNSPGLFRVDFSDGSVSKVYSPFDGLDRDFVVGGNGELAAVLTFLNSSGDWMIQNAAGDRIATGTNRDEDVYLRALGQNGDTVVYVVGAEGGEESTIYELALSGGAPTEILADQNVWRFYEDRRTGRLLGYASGGGEDDVHFFDPANENNVRKIRRTFAGLNSRVIDWSESFDQILARTSGNSDSGTWWMIDLAGKKANALGYERPGVPAAAVGPISTITYQAGDGMKIEGILTLPPGREAKNLPVVILPHGGPSSHDIARFDWWAQALASQGYAVLQPNFRGSTNRGEAFRAAGFGEWGGKMQTDLSDGLAYLAEQGIVDASRACIVGASYGGYAALAGVTLQQGIYRCAVSVAGVSDLKMMVQADMYESGRNPALARVIAAEIGRGDALREVSPRRFAAQADAPIMLIHGKDDVVVPIRQSKVMADALKDAGKPYEMVELEGEDHWLSLGETRLEMLRNTIAFVVRHNPPD